MKIVHSEYESGDTHSDICPPDCSSDYLKDKEYQELIHKCLQEWLDTSNGSGMFYIAEEGYIKQQVRKDMIL